MQTLTAKSPDPRNDTGMSRKGLSPPSERSCNCGYRLVEHLQSSRKRPELRHPQTTEHAESESASGCIARRRGPLQYAAERRPSSAGQYDKLQPRLTCESSAVVFGTARVPLEAGRSYLKQRLSPSINRPRQGKHSPRMNNACDDLLLAERQRI